jgi:Flp pilus assembly pilin Flp
VRARDGHGAEAGARPTHRPPGRRLRLLPLLRRDASGASSVEYGLLIALICGLLCVGVGVTVQKVFGDTVACFIAGIQGGSTANSTCATGPPLDPPVSNDAPAPGRVPVSPRPSPSPSPSPTVTPTPAP